MENIEISETLEDNSSLKTEDRFENKDIYPEMDYFLNESKSDVMFAINGHKIPANKPLLVYKSKVFEAMFSGNFKESEDKVIEIKDTTVEAFKSMLRFMYCEVFAITYDNDYQLVTDVCKLADRYQLRRLLTAIGVYYKSKITTDNFESIADFGFTYDMKELMEELEVFVNKNFTAFMTKSSEELMKIDFKTKNHLLKIIANNYRKAEQHFGGKSICVQNVGHRLFRNIWGYGLFDIDKFQ